MEIIITENKTLQEIQTAFQAHFPHLKIEFYRHKHGTGEGSRQEDRLDVKQTLQAVRTVHTEGELSINGHQKTSTLETRFRELYGLNIQVFRKAGRIWLQTLQTDHWTLAEQEKVAREEEERRRAMAEQRSDPEEAGYHQEYE